MLHSLDGKIHENAALLHGRSTALWLLSIPVFLIIPAFIVICLNGVTRIAGSLLYLMGLGYLTLSVVWLPAYLVALVWFWLRSRANPDWVHLLWYFPLWVAALIWCPSVMLAPPDFLSLLKMTALLAMWAVAGCGVFVAVIRVLLRYWRGV